jgi:DUF438 domain-containing protein
MSQVFFMLKSIDFIEKMKKEKKYFPFFLRYGGNPPYICTQQINN